MYSQVIRNMAVPVGEAAQMLQNVMSQCNHQEVPVLPQSVFGLRKLLPVVFPFCVSSSAAPLCGHLMTLRAAGLCLLFPCPSGSLGSPQTHTLAPACLARAENPQFGIPALIPTPSPARPPQPHRTSGRQKLKKLVSQAVRTGPASSIFHLTTMSAKALG